MEGKAKTGISPTRAEDFPQWFQSVVRDAEVAELDHVRGSMVIRPWGYGIWELMQRALDDGIKETGASNAYFPLFIPLSYFEEEAKHVEGFAKEMAVVTHHRLEQGEDGKLHPAAELPEPLIVRPTSETVIGRSFAKWINSYRDLPLMVNQWCNIVRWELRPRVLLRTTEFLWQEGHTAHATYDEAQAETLQMLEVYRGFMEDTLAVAVVTGEKSARERFAGADRTYTCEGLMGDGKALQMGTSHNLGHNFARAFDITYLSAQGTREHVATTSWGSSMRMLGGVIMVHGDDHGLRLPPAIAPYQVVLLALAEGEPARLVDKLAHELRAEGVRAHVDNRTHLSFGRRSIDWELKGVPVRIELGRRELAAGQATLVRRDTRAKEPVPVDGVVRAARQLLDQLQGDLHAESLRFREEHTQEVSSLEEFRERIGDGGFFRLLWCGSDQCEEALGAGTGASIRAILAEEPSGGACLADGAPGRHVVLVAKAY